jgi:hypothetical protein
MSAMQHEAQYDYRADPILAEALAYWQRKRGSRSMPPRRDIDPVEIPKLLPHIELVQIMPDGRSRFRLVGTLLVKAFGRDYTRRYADELFDGPRGETIVAQHRTVCVAGHPIFTRSRYLTEKRTDLIANRLSLPLSDNDLDVNMILAVLTLQHGTAPIAGEWGAAHVTATDIEMVDLELWFAAR